MYRNPVVSHLGAPRVGLTELGLLGGVGGTYRDKSQFSHGSENLSSSMVACRFSTIVASRECAQVLQWSMRRTWLTREQAPIYTYVVLVSGDQVGINGGPCDLKGG